MPSPQKKNKDKHPRLQEITAIALFFVGAFALISLLSYHHSDPSFFTQSKRPPLNFGGRMGANFAELLIQLFGIAAFVVCPLLITAAFKLFRGARPTVHAANLFAHIAALSGCAALLSLLLGSIEIGGGRVSSGGLTGAWISKTLVHYLNIGGALLFASCGFLIALLFVVPVSTQTSLKYLKSFFVFFGRGSWKFFERALWSTHARLRIAKLIERKLKASPISEPVISTTKPNKPRPSSEVNPRLASNSLSLLDDANHNDSLEVVPPAVMAKKLAKKIVKPAPSATPVGNFSLPPLEFLNDIPSASAELDRNRLIENSKILETKLTDFGIEGSVVAVRPGPVITMYEFKPGPGVKISQIAALADDLSLALSAQSVRIVAPIPGKNVVGIEIPNEERERVFLREILSTEEFQGSTLGIPLAIGKDISGAPITADLSRMPHLLIAGAPGAGKSVFINSLICSLLYKFSPNDMRLIMVDPKQLELNLYDDIPHLLLPVVDDPKKASTALKWATNEMERRYKIMAKSGIRNIAGFNEKLAKEGEEKMRALLCPQTADGMPDPTSLSHLFDHDEKGQPRIEHMPFILVIIDEFADLMMVAPKDIETSVARLAQKARASGIHLVIATQRPSVDVITGLIKANLPSRISFQVASKVDSRTILDGIGAEKLLGQGDMLFIPPGLSRLTRIHGAFVNEDEIGKICEHWKKQAEPIYKEEILLEPEESAQDEAEGAGDELYGQAVSIVRELGQASASMIQRRLKVGYNRAARMVEAMESQGIVGPADGARPREVLY